MWAIIGYEIVQQVSLHFRYLRYISSYIFNMEHNGWYYPTLPYHSAQPTHTQRLGSPVFPPPTKPSREPRTQSRALSTCRGAIWSVTAWIQKANDFGWFLPMVNGEEKTQGVHIEDLMKNPFLSTLQKEKESSQWCILCEHFYTSIRL